MSFFCFCPHVRVYARMSAKLRPYDAGARFCGRALVPAPKRALQGRTARHNIEWVAFLFFSFEEKHQARDDRQNDKLSC